MENFFPLQTTTIKNLFIASKIKFYAAQVIVTDLWASHKCTVTLCDIQSNSNINKFVKLYLGSKYIACAYEN